MPNLRPIVILGPTAGGKSALAVDLAQRLAGPSSGAGEIIGADAFQVYRRLDAGTAKPDRELRARIPHHLIDIAEPTQRFTVHDWLTRAHETIADIQSRGRTPIVVGGTNLYMKALLDGMFDGPGQDPAYRASLDTIDTAALHEKMKAIDPQSAERIKPADRQRIVRALEVYALTGQPISALQTQWEGESKQGIDATLIGMRWSPETINPRINLRVKAMFYPDKVEAALAAAVCINGESLIDEVKRLKNEGCFEPICDQQPVAPSRPGQSSQAAPERSEDAARSRSSAPNQAREALGYKQLLAWLEGSGGPITSLDDAFEKTKVLTRRFAKQQRTWLKRFTSAHWIDCDRQGPERWTEQAIAAISVNS